MIFFSPLKHTKQLLLVTFCHTTAGNGAYFRTHTRTNERTNAGWTDRRGSRNSYLDNLFVLLLWIEHFPESKPMD